MRSNHRPRAEVLTGFTRLVPEVPASSRGLGSPDLARSLDDQFELAALGIEVEVGAVAIRRRLEPALRRQCKSIAHDFYP